MWRRKPTRVSVQGPITPPLAWLIGWALLLGGCVAESLPSPTITQVNPSPADPGGVLLVEGRGFGASSGVAAVGGRGVTVQRWSDARVQLSLPQDLPSGAALVVLKTAEGRPTEGFPVIIGGDQGRTSGRRAFDPPPVADDGGVMPSPDASVDGGILPGDAQPLPDAMRPDANLGLRASFTPDPGGADVRVYMEEAATQSPGTLTLDVITPERAAVWGVAFHIAFDNSQVRLREFSPSNGNNIVAGALGEDRVAFGRLVRSPQVFTLTFDLVQPGQSRISFPTHNRTLRTADNQPIPDVQWLGGVITVEEAP
ncbi:MAG: hypothetical protein ACE366_05425 [Bradymonadia bacterium]